MKVSSALCAKISTLWMNLRPEPRWYGLLASTRKELTMLMNSWIVSSKVNCRFQSPIDFNAFFSSNLGFADENAQVQLQLLTAVVKLFLKRPQHTQGLVQHVLSLATQDSDNPDLRDRGFIYWR